ncbi:hypothetical protein [uncultured Gimesia sp.]|uniref:hypothetical protein n=1 Tax=uncultured Gimesia sp. TaxID=1678688 RepID=UPI00261C9BDA|nr:hypothetical protein [uncultured Gimesia sp.]
MWEPGILIDSIAEGIINSIPPEKREAMRQAELERLKTEPITVRELSKRFGISTKDMSSKLSSMDGAVKSGNKWRVPAKELPLQFFDHSKAQEAPEPAPRKRPEPDLYNKRTVYSAGEFSFDPLPKNGFSVISDIVTTSIEAIIELKARGEKGVAAVPSSAGPSIEVESLGIEKTLTHKNNFSVIHYDGETYYLSRLRAACFRVMWENQSAGRPPMKDLEIIVEADEASSTTRLRDVFKGQQIYGKVIVDVPGMPGYRQLVNF